MCERARNCPILAGTGSIVHGSSLRYAIELKSLTLLRTKMPNPRFVSLTCLRRR